MKDMKCDPLCCVTPWLPRIGFGIALAGFGINHFRHAGEFTAMAGSVFTVPLLATVATGLAYLVALLQVVGGVLFATKQLCGVAKFCILASLGGIMGWAGLAVMLSDGQPSADLVMAIINSVIFLLGYATIKKMSCCCSGGTCCAPGSK